MNKKTLAAALLACAPLLSAGASQAANVCGVTPPIDQFDSIYKPLWGCSQAQINDMWSRFSFDKDDWDGGFGYEDACNNNLPLMRTFNALQLLAYGVTTSPTCSTASSNVATWAYCWAGSSIDELDASCADDSRATTRTGSLDNWTQLKQPFFYNETVLQRAATIFHEARHAQGLCSHTSGCVDGDKSCDPSWNNGCVGFGSSSGKGANGYTVLFLNWFATTARSAWITTAVRANAVAEANYYLGRRFEQDPCFRMNSSGYTYSVC